MSVQQIMSLGMNSSGTRDAKMDEAQSTFWASERGLGEGGGGGGDPPCNSNADTHTHTHRY